MFDLINGLMTGMQQAAFLLASIVLWTIGAGVIWWQFHVRKNAYEAPGRIKEIRAVIPKKQEDDGAHGGVQHADDKAAKPPGKKEIAGLLFFLAIPMLFVIVGGWKGYEYLDMRYNGVWTSGRVVDVASHYDSDNGTMYSSVVRYTDYRGRSYQKADRYSSSGSAPYGVGETVNVYYSRENPEHFVMGGFMHNMILPIAFIGMGGLFIGLILLGVFASGKQKARKDIGDEKYDFTREMYYPVYEYRTNDGQMREIESNVGRNYLSNILPGRKVRMLVDRDNPDQASPRSLTGFMFAFFFLAMGAPFFYIAVFELKSSVYSFLGPFVLAAFLGVQLIPKWPKIKKGIAEFRKMRAEQVKSGEKTGGLFVKTSLDFAASKDNKTLVRLSPADIKARIRYLQRQKMIAGPLLLLIGFGAVFGAWYFAKDVTSMIQNGVHALGQVVRVEGHSSDNGYMYYAVVSFPDQNGRHIEFQDSVGSSTRLHDVGDQLNVLYQPSNPNDAMVDRGLWNWALPGGLALLAAFMFWAGGGMLRQGLAADRR